MIRNTNIVPTVGIVVFKSDDKSKVLLVRHAKGAGNLTGMYGLPAGRINDNESEKDAALRELEEESGLKTTNTDLVEFPNNVPIAHIKRKDGTIAKFSIKPFICLNYKGILRNSGETEPEWVDIMELSEYMLLPNVETIINNSIKYLWIK